MIPAILSCIFVLYLYRTLNAPDAPSAADVGEGDLVNRLDDLQRRLDRLAIHHKAENNA
jgi:hypothetical protein